MASPVPQDPNRVYYVAGGFQCSRPILTGDKAKPTFESIPTVDFSRINGSLEERKALAREVGLAASLVGFFYAVNPPVSSATMDKAFAAIQEFFDQPDEEKRKLDINKSPAAKGYQATREPGDTFDRRQLFTMGNDYTEVEQQHIKVAPAGSVPLNAWPESLPQFRKTLYEYYNEVYPFAKKLVQICALALGLEETALDKYFVAPLTDITIQHYPELADVRGDLGVLSAHADYSVFTLLLQNEVAGLQVLNANGIWVPCPPIKQAYVINTGNYMETWTNGRWPSTVHRVVTNSGARRSSLPFFLSPDPSVTVAPLAEIMEEGEESKHSPHPIGARHVKGMMSLRPTHPFVLKMKERNIPEDEYSYEMLSQPQAVF